MLRYTAEMIPAVTVPPRPKGLPIATTHSPTRVAEESPKVTKGKVLSERILSTARSDAASAPITSASYSVPSASVTVIDSSFARVSGGLITWLLVTTIPSAEMMKPEPSDCASRVCGWACPPPSPPLRRLNSSAKGVPAKGLFCTSTRWRVAILTTAGWSCAVRSAKLAGAPATGTTRSITAPSFCATCAPSGEPVISEMAAPPTSSALDSPYT